MKTISGRVNRAKTAEPIKIPFGMWTRIGPRNHILDGVPIPTREGTGTLKMREMKQWKRKRRHQNSGMETERNGNNDTMLQGVENARHEHSGKAEY